MDMSTKINVFQTVTAESYYSLDLKNGAIRNH